MLTISSRREAAGRAVAAARTWWRVWSGWAVTAIVVLSYLAWTVPALRQGGPEPFIHLGRTLVLKSQASPAISSRAASYAYDPLGRRTHKSAPASPKSISSTTVTTKSPNTTARPTCW